MNIKTMLAAATAAAALYAVPASAVTVVTPGSTTEVSPGVEYTGSGSLMGGQTFTWNFTVGNTPVFIDNFAFSGTGTEGGSRLEQVRYGIGTADTAFPMIIAPGSAAFAGGDIAGGTYQPGEEFALVITNNGSDAVSVTASFETAAVPVPAGGLLLMGALAGGAAMSRRKSKADA